MSRVGVVGLVAGCWLSFVACGKVDEPVTPGAGGSDAIGGEAGQRDGEPRDAGLGGLAGDATVQGGASGAGAESGVSGDGAGAESGGASGNGTESESEGGAGGASGASNIDSCGLDEGATNESCAAHELLCGAICADTRTDPKFCGATGDCNGAHAGKACTALELCAGGACRAPRAFDAQVSLEDGQHGQPTFAPFALTAKGRGMAVWSAYYFDAQPGSTANNEIWTSQFDAAVGWQAPVLIHAQAAGADVSPNVALDAQGNAMVIWNEAVGDAYEVWTRRFDVVHGWSAPFLLATPGEYAAFSPKVASDAQGNVIAIWYESPDIIGPVLDFVWSARYTAGLGWSKPERVDSGTAQDAFGPDVAIAPNGEAIATWTENDGQHFGVWTRHFTPGLGWSAAEPLEHDAANGYSSKLTFDRKGNAFASWTQEAGGQSSIWVRRYRAGCGWQPAQEIHAQGKEAYVPYVATGPDGEAFVTWYERALGGQLDIWAARFEIATGWQGAQRVSASGQDAFVPEVAIDEDGRALLVWEEGNFPALRVRTASYDRASGWSLSAPLQTDQSSSDRPHVGFLPNGDALTIWTGSSPAEKHVNSRRYR